MCWYRPPRAKAWVFAAGERVYLRNDRALEEERHAGDGAGGHGVDEADPVLSAQLDGKEGVGNGWSCLSNGSGLATRLDHGYAARQSTNRRCRQRVHVL